MAKKMLTQYYLNLLQIDNGEKWHLDLHEVIMEPPYYNNLTGIETFSLKIVIRVIILVIKKQTVELLEKGDIWEMGWNKVVKKSINL